MNNLPPGCTDADVDAAAPSVEVWACTECGGMFDATEPHLCACEAGPACAYCPDCAAATDARVRDLQDQQAEQMAHALNAIETALGKSTPDDEGDTRVCDQCGTDQVADMYWPTGYSDPKVYPPHYCVECGPAGVLTAREFDRRAGNCIACGEAIEDTNRDLDDEERCRFCAREYREAMAKDEEERRADFDRENGR